MSYEAPRDEHLREAIELSLALTLSGSILGGLVIFITFLPMVLSGGHAGNYFLAKIALPFGMLCTLRFEESSAMLLSLMQFPGYGVVIGVAHYLGWTRRAIFFLVVLHAAASHICFAVLPDFP